MTGRNRRSLASGLAVAALMIVVSGARADAQTPAELKRLTLEELMELEVTTVSRVAESTRLSPAAVFVLTQEDIRRSGATSVPEVLRLAPGVQVARIDAARWSIGMRGFADRLARSMLVLIDGRAVYSPLFAGTYWEVQDLILDDIDRIEVIRGPGGTLWGANAVNGIINIITRHARETQGVLASAAGGDDGALFFQAQVGGALGSGHARAYVKTTDRSPQAGATGQDYDDLRMVQTGFRADWGTPTTGTFMLSGDAYGVRLGQRATIARYAAPFSETVVRTAPLGGGNVLARWARPVGQHTEIQLQTYYDRTTRDEVPVAEDRDTFDVDYQQAHRRWARHTVVWGLGYRVSSGRITTVGPTSFTPARRTDTLVTGFAQDEITIVPARLRLTAGAKLEHNDYSGTGLQPSVRLLWTPTDRQSIVWSITRALRTPSRVETDYSTTSLSNPATPSFVRLLPNPDFAPEELVAHEAGYRVRPVDQVYLTFSGFYNQFDHLLSTDLLTPFAETTGDGSRVVLPIRFGNTLDGRSYGAELTMDARPAPWWRWTAQYSYLRAFAARRPGSTDVSQERRYEHGTPRHQVQVGTSLDLPHRWTADWHFRYASAMGFGPVPAYATSDLRVAWIATPALEVAVVGRNLHDARHLEWPGGALGNVEIRRTVLLKLTWRR